MMSSGKRHVAMALGLVLVVSACGGGAGNREGSGFFGNLFGGRGDRDAAAQSTAQTAPAAGSETAQAADTAEQEARSVADLGNLTPVGDLSKFETESVAGSGSFSKLFGNIFGGRRSDAPAQAAGQAQTAGGATVEPLVAADGTVYYPQTVQPQREGGVVGYFTGLFRPDEAPGASGNVSDATFGRNVQPDVTLRVNRYIWTAALDVLGFLPLETVDPFSGVFTTGYGTPPGGNRAYRATVYVQDPALDARSLNVALESRGGGPVNLETTRAIEDAILTRARQLWIAENES